MSGRLVASTLVFYIGALLYGARCGKWGMKLDRFPVTLAAAIAAFFCYLVVRG